VGARAGRMGDALYIKTPSARRLIVGKLLNLKYNAINLSNSISSKIIKIIIKLLNK
jgi:hypothetical protein